MKLFESALNLFGININDGAKEKEETLSSALAVSDDGDGSILAAAGNSGAAGFGIYLDIDGQSKNDIQQVKKYREISLFPEIDIAIQDIVNEAVPQESDSPQLELTLENLDASDKLKDIIQNEFQAVLDLFGYDDNSADLFRRWYIDGRLFFQVITDKEKPNLGIQKLLLLDATKTRKIKEIEKKPMPSGAYAVSVSNEYYVYNNAGFQINETTGAYLNAQGVKISKDSIIYAPSGYVDHNTGIVLSHLQKAIRPANQLRMLEDATVVYFISRAPERRIFYIDTGNLPKLKAEQYVKDMMNRYRNKMVYSAETGEVKNDKKYMSMLEDFFIPRQSGNKATEVQTLAGASNITGMLDNVEYFRNKLYQSLSIPVSRLQPDNGFNLGRSSEITRDELKFQKFVDRLRNKFIQIIYEALRIQLILKGIVNSNEWDDIKREIKFKFQTDNFFTESKRLDIIQSRLTILPLVDQYIGKYYSKEYVQREVLAMSDNDIEKMDEQIANEKDDPTAQPTGMGQMPDQIPDQGIPGQYGQEQQMGLPQDQGVQQVPEQELTQSSSYDVSKYNKR